MATSSEKVASDNNDWTDEFWSAESAKQTSQTTDRSLLAQSIHKARQHTGAATSRYK